MLAVMVMVMVTDADYDYGDDKDQTEADDTGKGAEEHCQDDSEVEGGPHLHKDQSYPPKIQTKNTKQKYKQRQISPPSPPHHPPALQGSQPALFFDP